MQGISFLVAPVYYLTGECEAFCREGLTMLFLSSRRSSVCSATTPFRSRASRRSSLTSSVVAAHAVSPASRFFPASMKSLDHLSQTPGEIPSRRQSSAMLSSPRRPSRRILFAPRPCDVFDDLLAGALCCLSHLPLLRGYDEPETLTYQIALSGPANADVRHSKVASRGRTVLPQPEFPTNSLHKTSTGCLKTDVMR